jgi:hypothetical protein
MVFEVDPDKPNTPAIARMLSGMSVLSLVASGICILFLFSAYDGADETYTMIGAGATFMLALIFVGQAKTIELLAVVSARACARFAMENAAKPWAPLLSPTPNAPPLRQSQKERLIHVSEEQTRQPGFNLKRAFQSSRFNTDHPSPQVIRETYI